MNYPLHFTGARIVLVIYACISLSANAQLIDSSIQLSNQINDNIIQVLTTPTDEREAPLGTVLPALSLYSLKAAGLTEEQQEQETQKAIACLLNTRKVFLNSLSEPEVHDFAHALHDSPMSALDIQKTVDMLGHGPVTDQQYNDLLETLSRPSPPVFRHVELAGHPTSGPPPYTFTGSATWKDYGNIYVQTETITFEESGWGDSSSDLSKAWGQSLDKSKITYSAKFDEKNSFTGKGLTDAYTNQLGWIYQTPRALSIQPSLSYQESDTDSHGVDTFHGNTFGSSLTFGQKILPFDAITKGQPNATMNISDDDKDLPCRYQPWTKSDHYPSCDLVLNLSVGFNDANTKTLTKHWVYSTQDTYALSPGLTFDYFNKKTSDGFAQHNDLTSLLPSSISITPTYSYGLMENQIGQSGSSGILSLKDQNSYLFTLKPSPSDTDCDKTPLQTLQVAEINSINHDTNQEGLTAPTNGYYEYQNWAQFGLSLTYSTQPPPAPAPDPCAKDDPKAMQSQSNDPGFRLQSIRAEYDYTAFNNQFEEHTVTLTVNFAF